MYFCTGWPIDSEVAAWEARPPVHSGLLCTLGGYQWTNGHWQVTFFIGLKKVFFFSFYKKKKQKHNNLNFTTYLFPLQ